MVNNLTGFFLTMLFVSLIAVPKSGFAIGAIPVNSLYIVFVLSLPLLILKFLCQKNVLRRNPMSNVYVVLILPFYSLFLLITLFNGIDNLATYAGYIIALIVSPLYFFFLFKILRPDVIKNSLPVIKYCLRFAAGYGVALFFYTAATGQFFEIPGISTTFGAIKTIDQRMNDRGELFKLTSTYNNGNIYAVCAMMLLPLYRILEEKLFWFLLFMASIMLTLSRLGWSLLLVYFILEYCVFSRAMSLKKVLIMMVCIAATVPVVLYLLQIMGRDIDFLFDPNLGGRASYLQKLFDASLISETSLYWSYEIPYVSIAEFVGLVGIPLFLFYFINIFINFKNLFQGRNQIARASTLGCVMYFLATLVDGALILVPVFSIFSFLVMLSLSGIGDDRYARGRDHQGWRSYLPQQRGSVAGAL